MSHSSEELSRDQYWMQKAIALAERAKQAAEVPVGAVLVLNDEIIAEGYNCPIATHDPTAHAEIVTLRKGAGAINNYRLVNAALYVTLEPCMMCAGAIVHSRIKRLIYGAADPKAGAIKSMSQSLDYAFLNHRVEHAGGILADQCSTLLSEFFRERR